jgi:hypothetical protein
MSKKTVDPSNFIFIALSLFQFSYRVHYTNDMQKTTKNISKNHALPFGSQEEGEIFGPEKNPTWELRRKKCG